VILIFFFFFFFFFFRDVHCCLGDRVAYSPSFDGSFVIFDRASRDVCILTVDSRRAMPEPAAENGARCPPFFWGGFFLYYFFILAQVPNARRR
jgi:hypothetical protein